MAETVAAAPVLWTELERPAQSVVVVRCHGRLVSGVEGVLYTQVRALMPATPRVVLDLEDLQHTDSTGLGTLARLYVSARSAGCNLELMHLNKQVRHVLGLTGMLEVFTVLGEQGGMRFM